VHAECFYCGLLAKLSLSVGLFRAGWQGKVRVFVCILLGDLAGKKTKWEITNVAVVNQAWLLVCRLGLASLFSRLCVIPAEGEEEE